MKRSAFTLTELVVVITIIAVLTAVLIPVLQNSRQRAKAVLCSSNIKQITVGLFIYDSQNQTLPFSFGKTIAAFPPGGYAGYNEYDRMGWWWFNFIEGFYRKSDARNTVIQCPSKRLTDSKLNNDILCGNYGVNRSICKSSDDRQAHREEFIGKPLSSTEIPKPGETLLVADSGYTMTSWWHAADKPPIILGNVPIEDTAYIPGLKINKNRKLLPGQEQDAINGRHQNKTVNVGFADGHISRTKANELFVEKTDDGYESKTPLWVPK
jgi:prepilin-type processing-associated H-X9-DG protein/prepilin-type N-terminal cleavage/methylation domain-containing protein